MSNPASAFLQSRKDRVDLNQHARHLLSVEGPTNDGRIVRSLSRNEITALKAANNHCENWSLVRLLVCISNDIDFSNWLSKHVSYNNFAGVRVVIGVSSNSTNKTEFDVGIHFNSRIENSVLDRDCNVQHNSLLRHSYIGESSVIMRNGDIDCVATFTDMLDVEVGPESGGARLLQVDPEADMPAVTSKMGMGSSKLPQLTSQQPALEMSLNLIAPNCVVKETTTVHNVVLSSHSSIVGANLVERAILLPNAIISHGASAQKVHMQWDTSISHNSHCSSCHLMEQAHVGPNSTVSNSVFGPDVHVSAGEVHASLLGPNSNAHHQSLVISVLMPLGRINVGYGANVGSNHTGRIPDQEAVGGEGTFWGLTTCVKFPVDLSLSPYTLVAAGTTLIPQRISMPFSLIVDKDDGCHLIPGWVLLHSPYTVARNEYKYSTRRKAKRHAHYTGYSMLRPDIMDLCIAARTSLQQGNRVAIGKTVLTDQSRQSGIDAYTKCIQRYALRGMLNWILEMVSACPIEEVAAANPAIIQAYDFSLPAWPKMPWEDDRNHDWWPHQKSVLLQEFGQPTSFEWIVKCLNLLVELENDWASRIYKSKQRDDTRGVKTIPGYAQAHVFVDDDSVAQKANEEAERVKKAVEQVVASVTIQRSKL